MYVAVMTFVIPVWFVTFALYLKIIIIIIITTRNVHGLANIVL